jgi:hypothetical protein
VKNLHWRRLHGFFGTTGNGLGVFGFFLKPDNALACVHLNDSKVPGLIYLHGKGGYCHFGIILFMEIDHLTNIHAINMVRSEHGDQVVTMTFYEVDVLINGVRRSLIPAFSRSLLSGDRQDKMIL